MKPTHFLFGATLALAGAGGVILATGNQGSSERREASPLTGSDKLAAAGQLGAAIRGYDQFVDENRESSDKNIQDRVAQARIRKGFALAKQKKWREARLVLLEAEKEYRGTGKLVPEEGGAQDEAAYQAAVCFFGEGRQSEGKRALLQFIDRYPDSPNVNGAYKRLMAMTAGPERDKIQGKLDRIAKARGERYALEVAKCGPRAVSYIAKLMDAMVPSEDALVKACKTDSTGTSMEGLTHGLKLCGLEGFGYELNRRDFDNVPLPAIWLRGNHYFVIVKVYANQANLYDPMTATTKAHKLPNLDDRSFTANVLTLKKASLAQGQRS